MLKYFARRRLEFFFKVLISRLEPSTKFDDAKKHIILYSRSKIEGD